MDKTKKLKSVLEKKLVSTAKKKKNIYKKLMGINPVNRVLTQKWWFDPKMTVSTRNIMKTHFLPWSTWFDPYWPGEIGFLWKMTVLTENDGFDPKRHENSFFTLVDMVWPVLTRWTRFW